MNKKLIQLFFFSTLFLMSCSTTQITSNTLIDLSDRQFESILYGVISMQTFSKALPQLDESSDRIYSLNSVKYGFRNIAKLSLSRTELIDEYIILAADSGYQYVLILEEKDYERSSNIHYNGGNSFSTSKQITQVLSSFLIDVKSKDEVWNAEIQVDSGDFGNSTQSGRSLAHTIIDKFKEDGVLPPFFTKSGNY
ncbi:MAG: hypothetical protein NXI08_08945 [bacterium]|nr:hypothetical protein [bacterium]